VDSPHIVGFQDEELLSDQYDDGDYNSETQGDIDSLWELEAAALHQSEASNKGERPFQNVGAGFARDQPYEEDTASEVAKDESFDPEEIIGGDDGYVVPPDVDHNRSSARSGFSAGTSFAERLQWVEDDNLNPNMSLIEPFAVNIGEDDLIFHLAAEGFRDTSRPLISPATGRQMRLPWMPYRIHHRIRDELIADMLASGAETRDIMDQFDPAALENVHNNPDEYADLKAVSAIRGKLSQRITRFRDRIGVLPVGGASRKKDTSKNKIVVRNNNVTANEELTFRRLSYEQNLVGVRGTYDSNTGTYNDNGVTHVAPIPANPPQRWIGTLNAVGRVTQGFIVHDYINSTGVFQGRPFSRYPFPQAAHPDCPRSETPGVAFQHQRRVSARPPPATQRAPSPVTSRMAQAAPQQSSAASQKQTHAGRRNASESSVGKRKRKEEDKETVASNDTNSAKRSCQEGAIGSGENCAFSRPMAQYEASPHSYGGDSTSGSRHVSSLIGSVLGPPSSRQANEREDFERFENETGMSFEQALGFDLENDDGSVNRPLRHSCDTEII